MVFLKECRELVFEAILFDFLTRSTRKPKQKFLFTNYQRISGGNFSDFKDVTKPIGERIEELLAVKLPRVEKITPAAYRRQYGKRPAIMKAIQCVLFHVIGFCAQILHARLARSK